VCLLGKSIGMRAMLEAGYQCFLARDLTDAHGKYDPAAKVTPDSFTQQVVEHFEKYLASSINMVETLQAAKHWPKDAIVDPVRIAPWGTVSRPHHFENSVTLTISLPTRPKAEIHYTLDGTEATMKSPRYTEPITISNTAHVKMAAFE